MATNISIPQSPVLDAYGRLNREWWLYFLAVADAAAGGSGITDLTGDVTASGTGSVVATIANDAVTYAKMQNVSAASKLLGRGSAGGAGDVEEITLGTGLTMTGTTLAAGGSQRYEITCTWLGLGVAIDPTFTELGFADVPVTGTIVYAKLLGSILGGSAVADVWKSTYAASPPTVANSIVGAAPPTVTAATKSLDTILPGWTPAVTAGDTIAFKLNSCVTFTSLKLILGVQPP